MLGLALSILLHGLLLLVLPEIPFLTGKPSEIRSDMELRFVIRDRFPAVSTGEASLAIGESVPGDASEKVSTGTETASLTEKGTAGSPDNTGTSSSGNPAETKAMPSMVSGRTSDGQSGYREPSETSGDNRSVVFRQGAGRQSTVGRPVITAATREPVYAMYYRAFRSRIEHIGNINFPQHNGVRLYGELTVRIPVYRNGAIDDREGGVSVERSSGSRELDNAALNIVRRAAPFGPFPGNAQTTADVWVIITRLKFTRDQGHRPQVQSTVR